MLQNQYNLGGIVACATITQNCRLAWRATVKLNVKPDVARDAFDLP